MKKILLLLLSLFISISLQAEEGATSPYIAFTDYNGSIKKESYEFGLYSQMKKGANTFDIIVGFKNISYQNSDSNSTDVNATDSNSTVSIPSESTKEIKVSLLSTYKIEDDLKLKTSFNYILSTEEVYDQVMSVLVGLEKNSSIFKYGANISIIKLNSESLTDYTQQISPYFGFYFGHINSTMGHFYTKIQYNAQHNYSINGDINSNYKSHSFSITHFKNKFETNFQLLFGESVYALRNNGLTIDNLGDTHKSGIILSTKYDLSDLGAIKFSYVKKDYISMGDTTETELKRYMLSIYFNF